MDLVLLGSHLKSGTLAPPDYLQYIQVLLTGLSIHALEGDPTQLRDFRDQIASITASLNEQSTDDSRFGRATGDDILLLVAQQLVKRLSGATLFRWSGPAILAMLEIATTAEAAENQATRAGAMSVAKTVQAETRSVLLPIHCLCRCREFPP